MNEVVWKMHGRRRRWQPSFEEKASADGGCGLLLAIHIFRGMPCILHAHGICGM